VLVDLGYYQWQPEGDTEAGAGEQGQCALHLTQVGGLA
jgi:hypothetical protein